MGTSEVSVQPKRGAVGITATKYAAIHGVSPQRIHQLIRSGRLAVLAVHTTPTRWYEIDPKTPLPAMQRPPGWPRGVPKPAGATLEGVLGGMRRSAAATAKRAARKPA